MTNFIRGGLIVLSLIGLLIGVSASLDDSLVFKLCGKSCGTTNAIRNLLGDEVARTLISFIWIAVSGFMGWLAIRMQDSKPATSIEPSGPSEARGFETHDKEP